MTKKTFTADIVCRSCGGTGVYQGFAEPPETAVVCLGCEGTGCEKYVLSYEPFEKRKRKRGVKWVQRSRGSLIVSGVGPHGDKISYKEFLNGKMP
jgi:hypothetical protein